MTDQAEGAEAMFAAVVARMVAETDGPGTMTAPAPDGPRRFGSETLTVDGKIFAMLKDGQLVVKLPRDRVDALIASGDGAPFGMTARRRPMREWVSVVPGTGDWVALAREARMFVAGSGG